MDLISESHSSRNGGHHISPAGGFPERTDPGCNFDWCHKISVVSYFSRSRATWRFIFISSYLYHSSLFTPFLHDIQLIERAVQILRTSPLSSPFDLFLSASHPLLHVISISLCNIRAFLDIDIRKARGSHGAKGNLEVTTYPSSRL
jgi:hypothetical protein